LPKVSSGAKAEGVFAAVGGTAVRTGEDVKSPKRTNATRNVTRPFGPGRREEVMLAFNLIENARYGEFGS
jgi:hypothetical protein